MKLIISLCFASFLYSQSQHIVALRVEFQEDQSEFTTGNGLFNLRANMSEDSVKNIVIDPPPHNRSYFEDHLIFAQNYFKKNLDIDLTFNVYPAGENRSYKLSEKMFVYNPNTKSDSLKGLVNLYKEAYELALADGLSIQVDDIVIIFHAGVGNDIFKALNNTPHDIPSLSLNEKRIERYENNWTSLGRSSKGILLPESASQEGLELAINGLVVANIGTQLGLLDLVDPIKKSTVVGPWALEDRGLFNAAGLLPAKPSVFNRLYVQKKLKSLPVLELTPSKLSKTITYYGNSLSAAESVYKIPLNTNEYFLIEQRYRPIFNQDSELSLDKLISKFTPVNSNFINYKEVLRHQDFTHRDDFTFSERGVLIDTKHFDAGIPHTGIAIWHVDQAQVDAFRASNDINRDENFRSLYFLEADGVDNYQTGGDGFNDERYDIFYQGNKAEYYQNKIDDASFPWTSSNYERAKSGIVINDFSPIAEEMSFSVSRQDIVFESFPKKIASLYTEKDSIFFAAISDDSLFLYQKGIGDIRFNKQAFTDSRFENHSIVLLNKNSVLAAKQSNLVRFNRVSGSVDSVYSFSSDIKKIYRIADDFFIQLSTTALFRLQNEELHQEFTELERVIQNENSLLIESNGVFYQISSSETNEIDFYEAAKASVSLGQELYGISYERNEISLHYGNGEVVEGFPLKIPYRGNFTEFDSLFTYTDYLVSIDKRNRIKITALYPKNNSNKSIYSGFRAKEIRFLESEGIDYICLISDSSFFQEKIAFPQKRSEEIASKGAGILNKEQSYIWPNPNRGSQMKLRISLNLSADVSIRIFTEIGLLLKEDHFRVEAKFPSDYKIPVQELANGTYIIQLSVGDEEKILKAAVIH